MIVLIRAKEKEELDLTLESDIVFANRVKNEPTFGYIGVNAAILIPRDFEDLSPKRQTILLDQASNMGIPILLCPETTSALDTEAARRFASSRIIRE